MATVPAHNLFAPVRACVMAAARFMPSVCGVLESSWSARIIFTPCSRQSIFGTLLAMINYIACRLRGKGVAGNRRFQVGVGKYDTGRLASEFDCDMLQISGGSLE